jgi:hypothetical protein
VYRCKIGVMQAGFDIEHEICERPATDATFASIDEILGPAAARYYGEGFTCGRHVIDDVRVDMAALSADATVQFGLTLDGRLPTDGVDGVAHPSISVIDCFVVSLQMVQVLMYEMDSLTRQDSDTLWMLSTVLEAPHAWEPYSGPVAARAGITSNHLLALNGRDWRNVTIKGECGGVKLRCSFAHRLPDSAERRVALAA